jgi:hypothetical protein
VRVFVVHHGRKPVAQVKKNVPGQHDTALLYVFKLQATARVKDDLGVHRDVRVMLSLSNTQPPTPSAFEHASLKRGRSYTSAGRRFAISKKPFEFWHARNIFKR